VKIDPFSSCYVKFANRQRDRQTDKQTNAGHYITSLAEVMTVGSGVACQESNAARAVYCLSVGPVTYAFWLFDGVSLISDYIHRTVRHNIRPICSL